MYYINCCFDVKRRPYIIPETHQYKGMTNLVGINVPLSNFDIEIDETNFYDNKILKEKYCQKIALIIKDKLEKIDGNGVLDIHFTPLFTTKEKFDRSKQSQIYRAKEELKSGRTHLEWLDGKSWEINSLIKYLEEDFLYTDENHIGTLFIIFADSPSAEQISLLNK